MGQKERAVKDYLSTPEKFADLMNLAIFDGEQKILPHQLHPCDTAKIYSVHRKKKNQREELELHELYRDLQKAFVMEDDKRRYVLLAVEHQSDIHYAMPERIMLYDATEYQRQVRRIRARRKKEYSGSFWKDEKLIPSITIVLYLGSQKWDGPRDILDMFDLDGFPEKLMNYITPYPIHVIAPTETEDDIINELQTDLQQVFLFVKHQHDKKKLAEVLSEDPGFRTMDPETARMISKITGTKLTIKDPEEGETIDMSNAIQEMMNDAKAEGLRDGLEKGDRRRLSSAVIGCHREGISFETISKALSIPVADVMRIIAGAEAE